MNKQDRARGCLLGLYIGDAIGAMYEFETESKLRNKCFTVNNIIVEGGPHGLSKGQITDDSEMAISMAKSIIENGSYNPKKAREWYMKWINSNPFDVGNTVGNALYFNQISADSESNGALMRLAPIAIADAEKDLETIKKDAEADAHITHNNIIVDSVNVIMASAMAYAISNGLDAEDIYRYMIDCSEKIDAPDVVKATLEIARTEEPEMCDGPNMGWVLIAFQLAVYHMLNSESISDSIIATIKKGGDTDTNGAIIGMLLGSLYGIDGFPKYWISSVLECAPIENSSCPRPRVWWGCDAFDIADKLLALN